MKKRIYTLLLFLTTVVLLFPAVGCNNSKNNSDSDPVNIFTYEISGSNATITGLVRTTYIPADIIIPSSIDDYSVTAIDDNAFKDWTSLSSVTIPAGVKSIGDSVFSGCYGLSKINVDSSNSNYITINWVLLSKDMSKIICYPPGKTGTSYNIPASVKSIGASAFNGCSSLTGINIPLGVTSIGSYAFNNCTSLNNITLPAGLTTIENNTFSGCTDLPKINIPSNITSIGNNAFNGCSNLVSIGSISAPTTLPPGVTYIGHDAFRDCAGLPEITIPDAVTYLGYDAFHGCSGLESANIPAGIERIETGTFASCTGLTVITIPSTVKYIDSLAFIGCSGLTSVTVPSSVIKIYSSTFSFCTGLTEILVDSGNTNYISDDGVLFDIDKKEIMTYPAGKTAINYTIPDGVETICINAFSYCSLLENITIPDSVKSIGWEAFSGCSGLTSMTIPVNVTEIYNTAFDDCSSLDTIRVNAATPPKILPPEQTNLSFLLNCIAISAIDVPSGKIPVYKAAYGWNLYSDLIAE